MVCYKRLCTSQKFTEANKKSYTISQLYFDTRNQPPPPPPDILYDEKSVDHLPASGAAK